MFFSTDKDDIAVAKKQVDSVKEQFSRFEHKWTSFKNELDIKRELQSIKRELNESDCWLQCGPHTLSDLRVSARAALPPYTERNTYIHICLCTNE